MKHASEAPLSSVFAAHRWRLVGSVVLDHFGVLHARQPVDALRVVGLLMVVAGALLVVKPWQPAGG